MIGWVVVGYVRVPLTAYLGTIFITTGYDGRWPFLEFNNTSNDLTLPWYSFTKKCIYVCFSSYCTIATDVMQQMYLLMLFILSCNRYLRQRKKTMYMYAKDFHHVGSCSSILATVAFCNVTKSSSAKSISSSVLALLNRLIR